MIHSFEFCVKETGDIGVVCEVNGFLVKVSGLTGGVIGEGITFEHGIHGRIMAINTHTEVLPYLDSTITLSRDIYQEGRLPAIDLLTSHSTILSPKFVGEKQYGAVIRAQRVRKKDGVIFQGDATSVTSTNDKGVFDVLPQHTNFVAVIKNTLIIRPLQKPPVTISVPRGIIHVKKNTVEVFVGI